jgi:hypothetical protein
MRMGRRSWMRARTRERGWLMAGLLVLGHKLQM